MFCEPFYTFWRPFFKFGNLFEGSITEDNHGSVCGATVGYGEEGLVNPGAFIINCGVNSIMDCRLIQEVWPAAGGGEVKSQQSGTFSSKFTICTVCSIVLMEYENNFNKKIKKINLNFKTFIHCRISLTSTVCVESFNLRCHER